MFFFWAVLLLPRFYVPLLLGLGERTCACPFFFPPVRTHACKMGLPHQSSSSSGGFSSFGRPSLGITVGNSQNSQGLVCRVQVLGAGQSPLQLPLRLGANPEPRTRSGHVAWKKHRSHLLAGAKKAVKKRKGSNHGKHWRPILGTQSREIKVRLSFEGEKTRSILVHAYTPACPRVHPPKMGFLDMS